MNYRNIFTFSVITATGLALLPGSALAQQKSLKEQLVGVWTIVSWERDEQGWQQIPAPWLHRRGVHVFDANGRFLYPVRRVPIFRSSRRTTR